MPEQAQNEVPRKKFPVPYDTIDGTLEEKTLNHISARRPGRLIFVLLLALLTWGCGNSFEETINPGPPGPGPSGTATIRLLSTLERSVPTAVSQIRLSGFNANGQRLFGPTTQAKSASIDFTSIPVAVTTVRIDYLAQNETVGVAIVPVALVAGEVFVISNPDFDDVTELLERLTLSPQNISLGNGLSQPYTVIGILDDGTQITLTDELTWNSSNPSVATIDSAGRATAQQLGQTTITASFEDLSVSTNLTVTDAVVTGLSISPLTPQVALGREQQFSVSATLSDGSTENATSTATWTSSNQTVAINPVSGLTATVGQGTTTISASLGGQSAQTTLTVTPAVLDRIAIDQGDVTAVPGSTRQFTASGFYSDGSTTDITEQATWSAEAGVTINQSGEAVVDGAIGGSSAISASLPGTEFSSSIDVYIRRYVYVATNRRGDATQQATIAPGLLTYTASDTNGALTELPSSFISFENPALENPELAIGGVAHPSGRYIYFTTSSANNLFYQPDSGSVGRLLVYNVDLATGRLTLAHETSLEDAGSDVDIDPTGRYLALGTNNNGGKVRLYTLDPNTGNANLLDTEILGGNSSTPLRQLAFSRTLPYLYVTSNDGFFPQAGLFALNYGATGIEKFTGPNMNPFKSDGYNFIGGVSVHPALNFLFTSSTSTSGGFVSGVRADASNGSLLEANRLTDTGINATRSAVSMSGTDLYVCGTDSMTAVRHYSINQTNAEITFVGSNLTGGFLCSGVAVDGSDRFVYATTSAYVPGGVVNRQGTLTAFTRNQTNGTLTQTQTLDVSGGEVVTSP